MAIKYKHKITGVIAEVPEVHEVPPEDRREHARLIRMMDITTVKWERHTEPTPEPESKPEPTPEPTPAPKKRAGRPRKIQGEN